MILKFTTKRDRNGNKYFLGFDTEKKIYSLQSSHWYSVSDYPNISKTDRRKLIEEIQNNGFTEVDNI